MAAGLEDEGLTLVAADEPGTGGVQKNAHHYVCKEPRMKKKRIRNDQSQATVSFRHSLFWFFFTSGPTLRSISKGLLTLFTSPFSSSIAFENDLQCFLLGCEGFLLLGPNPKSRRSDGLANATKSSRVSFFFLHPIQSLSWIVTALWKRVIVSG